MAKFTILIFASLLAVGYGFGIKEIWDYLIGGGYGNQYPYPGQYPSGPGYYPGGNHNGQYPGNQYPGNNYPGYGPGLDGPPGAHPGCPLCDSSVYSYCSHKQAHDSCCCDNSYGSFNCPNTNCKFLYANNCQEYNLISRCCCVDLQKNAPVVAVAPVA